MFRNASLFALFVLASANTGHPASVPVKHIQGATRGFLTVHSEGRAFLANGELTQIATSNRVTSKGGPVVSIELAGATFAGGEK
jgi:hypothetical protein